MRAWNYIIEVAKGQKADALCLHDRIPMNIILILRDFLIYNNCEINSLGGPFDTMRLS
jgi:hypothetical protein